jgi:L-alanine-DL-glutamate epimerase-like enolase superfamily enzyme
MKSTDIRCVDTELYFLPVNTRVPLKFGRETVNFVTCARVKMTVEDTNGNRAVGWGETPLSVTWVWPSSMSYDSRHGVMKNFCVRLAKEWTKFDCRGHALEVGNEFNRHALPKLLQDVNQTRTGMEPMPWLGALVCNSLFDIALHDAYGRLVKRPVYSTYNDEFMSKTLVDLVEPAADTEVSFKDLYPNDFVTRKPANKRLRAWHLVGGVDKLTRAEASADDPADGYPVFLPDWIEVDGLKCLKIKLRGNDSEWDYDRLVKIGEIAIATNVEWLTADFNCTVTNPEYVNEILDRLCLEHPRLYGMMLYVEQPFPYDLEKHRIDVHSVSARKPLFLDESAHDWEHIRLGRELGWTGVALKTCKTQTGAILSACWAKAHGMTLMVQDLTNPMMAQNPHCLLAAHVGTIMGVETNAMQFYPAASKPEMVVHPGIHQRRDGCVDISTLTGHGFSYFEDQVQRDLPDPEVSYSAQ